MKGDLEKSKSTTLLIAADLSRKYKATQEHLINTINKLDSTLVQYEEELEMLKHELSVNKAEKEDKITLREQQAHELRKKLNTMTAEFAQMLGSTVTTLKEKLSHLVINESSCEDKKQETNEYRQNGVYLQKMEEFTLEINPSPVYNS